MTYFVTGFMTEVRTKHTKQRIKYLCKESVKMWYEWTALHHDTLFNFFWYETKFVRSIVQISVGCKDIHAWKPQNDARWVSPYSTSATPFSLEWG